MGEKPKFDIDDYLYWVESSSNYGKLVPCEMCFGKLQITITLGNGEKINSQCGYCSHGYDEPSGQMKIWEPTAVIHGGIVSGLSKENDGWTYTVGHRSLGEHELYKNKEDAEPRRQKKAEEEIQRSDKFFEDDFVRTKKKQIWSIGYHREQIKSHRRSIEWHDLRLGMIKGKQK